MALHCRLLQPGGLYVAKDRSYRADQVPAVELEAVAPEHLALSLPADVLRSRAPLAGSFPSNMPNCSWQRLRHILNGNRLGRRELCCVVCAHPLHIACASRDAFGYASTLKATKITAAP